MNAVSAPAQATPIELANSLLARIAARDRQAFEALYRLTSPRLLGICLRVLGDRAEAEDVLQEVYVAVWAKAEQFDARYSSAFTWLGVIARNRAIDHSRALPSALARAPIEVIDEVHDSAPSPAARTEALADRARLDDCFAQLEPKRQALIRTAFFDGATYEELATRIGSPLGSVKSWIRRGLTQLRACLEL